MLESYENLNDTFFFKDFSMFLDFEEDTGRSGVRSALGILKVLFANPSDCNGNISFLFICYEFMLSFLNLILFC